MVSKLAGVISPSVSHQGPHGESHGARNLVFQRGFKILDRDSCQFRVPCRAHPLGDFTRGGIRCVTVPIPYLCWRDV